MNREEVIDALGEIDIAMIRVVEKLRYSKKKTMWPRWTVLAACIALVVSVGWMVATHIQREKPVEIELNVIQLLYVNHVKYSPDADLSQTASEENVGDYVGMVSPDNEKITQIKAFAYIPDDGKTNRIIVPYKGEYFVYEFLRHYSDGSDGWPGDLLQNAVRAEIRDIDYSENKVVYATISAPNEINEISSFLSGLQGKHTLQELERHYFALFKDQFGEGEIWIDESGKLNIKQGFSTISRFYDLVEGDGRTIVVTLEDNTRLTYSYKEGAGVILCHDFGYVLTKEQVERINHLVGLN